MGVVGRVLFTKWAKIGYGEQLNWLGRGVKRALTSSTTSVNSTREVAGVEQGDLAARIGVVFKRIPGGEFIYQGRPETIEAYEAAETEFTIGMLKELLELEGDRVRAIFNCPGYSVEDVIQKSYDAIAKDVPEAERDNCPLVYTEQREENAIAELVGASVITDKQWERAAAGTDGKLRPWGNDLDHDKAVYWQEGANNGTRPVKSKPADVSTEGLYDLIGNVWERTREAVLRGGSWDDFDESSLQADSRLDFFRPGSRYADLGVRFSRTGK
jgi:formylglycine-generating enzyme required for sulfatase activity